MRERQKRAQDQFLKFRASFRSQTIDDHRRRRSSMHMTHMRPVVHHAPKTIESRKTKPKDVEDFVIQAVSERPQDGGKRGNPFKRPSFAVSPTLQDESFPESSEDQATALMPMPAASTSSAGGSPAQPLPEDLSALLQAAWQSQRLP
jgi:hypothetical protein